MSVQWGWRCPCRHPDCSNVLEAWSETGVPGLFENVPEGWTWDQGRYTEEGWVRVYDYIVFCPDHSAPVIEYRAQLKQWKADRYQVGKTTHTRLIDQLKDWGAKLLGIKVGQTVQEWETENPQPQPPWEDE